VTGVESGTLDAVVVGSIVAAEELTVGEADGGVAAGDEEQLATKRPRQLTAKSLLAPQAVIPIGLARF
jgi:hypothetical protein